MRIMLEEKIRATVRDIPDFPKEGIVFKDITPILAQPGLMRDIIDSFEERLAGIPVDAIACIESRGFWFGTILAHHFQVPIVPVRKKGKLPSETHSIEYDLEYGNATLEAHRDSIITGHNILIHDDVLATGGTAQATAQLIQDLGGTVSGFAFLINLSFLNGHQKIVRFSDKLISLVDY